MGVCLSVCLCITLSILSMAIVDNSAFNWQLKNIMSLTCNSVTYYHVKCTRQLHYAGNWDISGCTFQGKLFEEIAEGLKRARVVIVCASDEVCVISWTLCFVKYEVMCLVAFKHVFIFTAFTLHCCSAWLHHNCFWLLSVCQVTQLPDGVPFCCNSTATADCHCCRGHWQHMGSYWGSLSVLLTIFHATPCLSK